MANEDLEISGANEFAEELEKMLQEQPKICEKALKSVGNKFRKRVRQVTKESTEKITGKLIRGYSLSKVSRNGFGDMDIDFYATSPHFHLVEHGHVQKDKKGKEIGVVPGRLMVHQVREEFKDTMPEELQKALDILLKKEGLL